IQWANQSGSALTPRGAGSGIPGNAPGTGIIVDLRERMPRRLEIDDARRTATTSANITQAELNQALAPFQLRLPPDPSSSRWATLGGMVSTNASGSRTVRYGPTRSWVDAVECVTADGETGWLERKKNAPRLAAIERLHRDIIPRILANDA